MLYTILTTYLNFSVTLIHTHVSLSLIFEIVKSDNIEKGDR